MLDDWSMSQRRWKKKLYLALGGRAMLERAAAVHCTAAFEQEQAQKWFPKGRGVTIPLVFDVEPFSGDIDVSEAPGPDKGQRPRLLFLSRIHEKKGLDRLLEAAALLERDGQSVDVLIAGTGDEAYEREMRRLAERLGLDARAHFLGLVTGEAKAALYASADLFVLPTSQENFGFVCPEALACGTPAVTTRGVDIWPELQESGGAEIAENTAEGVAKMCIRDSWYGVRRGILRLFGAKIDRTARIRSSVRVEQPWNLAVGSNTMVGDNAVLYCLGKVTIGANCSLSQYAHLCAGTHDYTRPDMPLLTLPITLGDEVWIAADAFVGPGVTVGDGVVVGARSSVHRSLEPWGVYAGNPAKRIKDRTYTDPAVVPSQENGDG